MSEVQVFEKQSKLSALYALPRFSCEPIIFCCDEANKKEAYFAMSNSSSTLNHKNILDSVSAKNGKTGTLGSSIAKKSPIFCREDHKIIPSIVWLEYILCTYDISLNGFIQRIMTHVAAIWHAEKQQAEKRIREIGRNLFHHFSYF